MRYIFTSCFLLISIFISAQKPSCAPRPGTTVVCDSMRNFCRIGAYYMTMTAVAKPTSRYHDSLYYPRELMYNYSLALAALYNDLPDSLNDFRSYLGYFYNPRDRFYGCFHPDSSLITTIILPQRAIDTQAKDETQSGNARIDSLMIACGIPFVSRKTFANTNEELKYLFPPMINRNFILERLKKIDPSIIMTPVIMYSPYGLMEISEGTESFEIRLTAPSPCMPPELPCSFSTWIYVYEFDQPLRYSRKESGVIPWPQDIIED